MGISCWIAHKAVWTPEKASVRTPTRELSYRDFEDRVAHLAGYLVDSQNIREGDRVGFLGSNSPELLDLLFACARIGAIFVPFNSRMTGEQIAILMANCEPSCIFVDPEFSHTIETTTKIIKDTNVIYITEEEVENFDSIQVESLVNTSRAIACNPSRDQDIPVMIVYTSGTTGIPKGVVYTQQALTFSAVNSNLSYNMRARDEVLTFLPMFHVGGLLIHTLPAFHVGATVTIHNGFDAGHVLKAIEEHGISLILPAEPMSRALTSHPDWNDTDLSSIRCVGIGGAAVPRETMQPWFDLDIPTMQQYGLTETAPPTLASPWESHQRKSHTVGTSVLYCQARVVNENMERLPAGEVGEIVVRGNMLFKEYWRNPEATRDAFKDGWFRTGDLALVDEDGYFQIVDRIKNIIIVGTSNVYPSDLEEIMLECEAIEECAVVGRPDPETGEAIVACVVLKDGSTMTEAEVKNLFAGRLADYQHPKYVVFMDEFPKTSLGKIQKSVVKKSVEKLI